MEYWMQVLDRFGVAVAVLVFCAGCTVWIGRRLLSEKNGIVTMLAKRHVEFVDGSERKAAESLAMQSQLLEVQVRQVGLSEDLARHVQDLVDMHSGSDSQFSTLALQNAALKTCDLMDEICDRLEIDHEKSINGIRAALVSRRDCESRT